ncbi:hypothetical protein [uncultured Brevundimonas sp.]|uniref:hypothetical protein n=1 Tax=uncultured Brevundimonas sp. TaxID=213418 RepID=UPI00262E40B0|nr:hypothetical protein [uncultured Brevundimonas sp.]
MTGTKLTSDAALKTGPKLLKMYGTWSKMLANGELRDDGVIVVKPKPAPKPRAKIAA